MSDQETNTPTSPEVQPQAAQAEDAQSGQPGAATTPERPAAGASQAAPLLMGVKLPIRVLLGRTQLPLREIAQLGNGAIVELDCSPDDPVDIVVNDRVIAHGEVVVVAGNYGVRITKMASRNESAEAAGEASAELISFSQKLR